MANPNNRRDEKSDLKSNEGLILPKTLHHSSASSTGASGSSVDAIRPDSSTSPPPPTSSSSGLTFSKSKCAICLDRIKKKDGKAIYTAECSHSFHFDCITSNVKHGNRVCPICRNPWKQVPLFVDGRVYVPIFPSQRGLPHGEAQIQSDDGQHSGVDQGQEALEIKLLPQVSAVAKSVTRSDFAVLVHLKAGNVSDGRPTRTPMDLITVLDVSGSMDGSKIELLKTAVGFVIQNLSEYDRLSVVAFSSRARRLFPLRVMSEMGKQEAIRAVNSLVAGGGTNIEKGLRIGARVIEDRRWKNPVSVMMLFSDGQDNNFTFSDAEVRTRTDYESLLPSSTSRFRIHTFGFGSDHDAELMRTISRVSNGMFSFIETETVIRDAFSQRIGGRLIVLASQGLKIPSMKTGSYRNRISPDGRHASINVGNMYAEEERDFIVLLDVPCCHNGSAEPESMSLLKVRFVFQDPVRRDVVCVESGDVIIQRPTELTGEEVVSIEVDRQLNRFLVSQAISEARVLADGGDLSAAIELLRDSERDLSETLSARSSDGLCQSLSAELRALRKKR